MCTYNSRTIKFTLLVRYNTRITAARCASMPINKVLLYLLLFIRIINADRSLNYEFSLYNYLVTIVYSEPAAYLFGIVPLYISSNEIAVKTSYFHLYIQKVF